MKASVELKSLIKAIIAGTIAGFAFFILFPYLTVQLNQYLGIGKWNYLFLDIWGVVMILTGIIVFLYCSGVFAKLGEGTPAPIEPPQKLVITGIYKYTRNPIYLGYFSILLGEFLFFGYILLLAYFLLIVVFINLYLRLWEEPKLKQRFGQNYIEYTQQVPRWFKI